MVETVDRKMHFFEHLAELRKRIVIAVAGVFAAGSVAYYFALDILEIILRPAGDIQLVYLSPLEPFMVKFKIALFTGIGVAMPLILYQIIAFASPALKEKERKVIYPTIVFLWVLFVSGVVFGYYYIMPVGTEWLLQQAGEVIKASVSASMYITYAGWFLIGFGISFETPLFILLLVRFGAISPQALRKSWRYSVLIVLIVAAVVTPDWNPVTMVIMAAPMLVFYLISILLAPLVKPKPKEI